MRAFLTTLSWLAAGVMASATAGDALAARPWVDYASTSFTLNRNTGDVAHSSTLVINFLCARGWDFAGHVPVDKKGAFELYASDSNAPTSETAVYWSVSYQSGDFDCRKLVADGPHSRRLSITVIARASYDNYETKVHYAGQLTRLRLDLRFTRSPTPLFSEPRHVNGQDYQVDFWEAIYPSSDVEMTGFVGLEGGPNFFLPPDQYDVARWNDQRGRIADPRYCIPQSCDEAGAECGPVVPDGCGNTIDCGDPCLEPEVCDVYHFVCCQPGPCPAEVECGLRENACGTFTDCGKCAPGFTCQADNTCLAD